MTFCSLCLNVLAEYRLMNYNNGQYSGDVVNGKPDGFGTWETGSWRAKTTYSGHWKNGLFDGYGTISFSDGSSYVGYWKKGKYDGKGTFSHLSKGVYQSGYFENGVYIGTSPRTTSNSYSASNKTSLGVSDNEVLRKGRKLLKNYEYYSSIRCLEPIANKNNAEAQHLIALSYLWLEKYEEWARWLKEAVNNNFNKAQFTLGLVYSFYKKYSSAKELFKKAYSNNHPVAKRAYNYVNDIVNGDKTYDDLLDLLEDEYGMSYEEDDVIDFAVEHLCNSIYINVIVNNGK